MQGSIRARWVCVQVGARKGVLVQVGAYKERPCMRGLEGEGMRAEVPPEPEANNSHFLSEIPCQQSLELNIDDFDRPFFLPITFSNERRCFITPTNSSWFIECVVMFQQAFHVGAIQRIHVDTMIVAIRHK